MAGRTVASFGSWRSPISAEAVAGGQIGLGQVQASGSAVYWTERRPGEGGRSVVVRWTERGGPQDAVPQGFDVRTRVHEYGGGDFLVVGDSLFVSNRDDQRLYRLDPGEPPRPISPEPAVPAGLRYADARPVAGGALLVCVRERHEEGLVENEIVAVPSDGSGDPRVLISGHDFFAAPRVSPDGRRLAWLSWDHPNMPWDGTELWVANVSVDGEVSDARRIAGGHVGVIAGMVAVPAPFGHVAEHVVEAPGVGLIGADVESEQPVLAAHGVDTGTIGGMSYIDCNRNMRIDSEGTRLRAAQTDFLRARSALREAAGVLGDLDAAGLREFEELFQTVGASAVHAPRLPCVRLRRPHRVHSLQRGGGRRGGARPGARPP